jgi:HSP20 family protein
MTRNPFREFTRLERAMEDMFGRLPTWGDWDRGTTPAVDMIDRADEIVVRADVPGFEAKEIDVTVTDHTLVIKGEHKEEKEEKKEDYYYNERSWGAFARTVTLPANVDAAAIKATVAKGVLEVHLPKAKEAKGTKIEVKAA